MGKPAHLFKKIGDTKGKCHANRGTIQERNCTDLTEAEAIKRGGGNTQMNYAHNIFMALI